jgi:hypothetical protein
MEQPNTYTNNTIYFEVLKGKGVLHYDGRKANVVPPSVHMVLLGIDKLVHPALDRHSEFYVLPKKDEETDRVPIISPEEIQHTTLEGKTMRFANGKVTLDR